MPFRTDFDKDTEFKKRLLFIMALRVVLITVLLGATIALNMQREDTFSTPSVQFLLGLVAITYLLSIGWAVWFRTGRQMLLLTRAQLTLDLLFWGCLTYATGGVASGFSALFDLWVIVWAVVLGGRAAFHAAAAATGLLAVLGGLMQSELLLPLPDQLHGVLPPRTFAYSLGVNICALFVVAGLVNSLVKKLEHTGLGLQIERTRRADLAQIHSDMIRSLTVGMATTRLSGEILTMNPAGLDILGRRFGEIEDRPLWEWLPELTGQLNPSSSGRSRGRGSAIGLNGTRVPIEYIVAPLSSAEGEMQGFIVIFSDLTEVRRLESALEKSRRFAALGELAASLAHEIRNPLGALSGAFQILASSSSLSEEDVSLIDIVQREIHRMDRLVTDVLDYSRPKKREPDLVDLSSLVRETVRTFQLDEEVMERVVDVRLPEKLVQRADGAQLKQVLWNLLRNALQATEPGDEIGVELKSDENGALLEIRDTGLGIPEEIIGDIFDPFFSTRERGLGLGLALCRRIVEEHRGRIDVKMRDGGGTLFRIKLPMT